MYSAKRMGRTRPPLWIFVVCAIAIISIVFLNERLAQSGIETPFAAIVTAIEIPFGAVSRTLLNAAGNISAIPDLTQENASLRAQNTRLNEQLAQLRESAATRVRDRAITALANVYTKSIIADCVGYDPENAQRSIVIDQGSFAGVTRDAGVINDQGVVGRVISVTPFSSTVLLLESYTSNIPAIVQPGRYWGIARGALAHIRLDNVALDAPLKLGQMVVTGRGRSFPAGVPIGRIIAVSRSDAALSQTAIVAPNVHFARLERVLVLTHQVP